MCKYENRVIKKIERKVMPHAKMRAEMLSKEMGLCLKYRQQVNNEFKSSAIEELQNLDEFISKAKKQLAQDISEDTHKSLQETKSSLDLEGESVAARIMSIGWVSFEEDVIDCLGEFIEQAHEMEITEREQEYIKTIKKNLDGFYEDSLQSLKEQLNN